MRAGYVTALALSAVLLAGCKDDKGTGTGSTGSSSGSTGSSSGTPSSSGTMSGAPTTMPSGAGAMGLPATMPAMSMPATVPGASALDTIKGKAGDLKDQAAQTASDLQRKAADAAAKPADPAAPAAGGMQEQAQKLIDEVNKHLKDGKLDMAEQSLQKLDGMKASLSPEWQGRVDQLKTAVATAKKANIQIPGVR